MVHAWYMDDSSDHPENPHQLSPPEFLSMDLVKMLTGVEFFELNPKTYMTDGVLDKIRKERNYTYEDEVTISQDTVPRFTQKLKLFFEEHLHTDEEIRLIVDGSGYFDVRDKNDKWIRLEVAAGDMLILPSGMFHRFTPDRNMYIKAKRYFIGDPLWVAHNRMGSNAEHMDCRKEYLEKIETEI